MLPCSTLLQRLGFPLVTLTRLVRSQSMACAAWCSAATRSNHEAQHHPWHSVHPDLGVSYGPDPVLHDSLTRRIETMKLDRRFYTPQGYQLIAKDERFGFEVWGQLQPRVVALAFGGKRSKPDWHFRFQDEARLHAKIEETLRGFMQSQERKAAWKAERNQPHDVKIGDVFKCSWGYEQTNIDFYEVTNVFGAMVELTPIAQESEETHFMQGECVPCPGAYTGAPMRKRVSNYNKEPSIRIASYASAYRMKPMTMIGNKPIFKSSHYTAYA